MLVRPVLVEENEIQLDGYRLEGLPGVTVDSRFYGPEEVSDFEEIYLRSTLGDFLYSFIDTREFGSTDYSVTATPYYSQHNLNTTTLNRGERWAISAQNCVAVRTFYRLPLGHLIKP